MFRLAKNQASRGNGAVGPHCQTETQVKSPGPGVNFKDAPEDLVTKNMEDSHQDDESQQQPEAETSGERLH